MATWIVQVKCIVEGLELALRRDELLAVGICSLGKGRVGEGEEKMGAKRREKIEPQGQLSKHGPRLKPACPTIHKQGSIV